MSVEYTAASPEGEIPLGPADCARPFRIRPDTDHPFLTLGNYLDAVRDFVLTEVPRRVADRGRNLGSKKVSMEPASCLRRIRTEKHGALYHVCCAEWQEGSGIAPVAVMTAITREACARLHQEFEVVERLAGRLSLPCLPQAYCLQDSAIRLGSQSVPCAMMAAEWMPDYHEWHWSKPSLGDDNRIRIWDSTEGYRWASKAEAWEILRQCARILTRYYDPETRCQIRAWHHAAGDFVVQGRGRSLKVRLSTARAYEPLAVLAGDVSLHPAVGLIYFYLHMTLHNRLDRLDGTGAPVWAGEESVAAGTQGFLDALQDRRAEGDALIPEIRQMVELFRSFSVSEWMQIGEGLRAENRDEDHEEASLIERYLEAHLKTVRSVLQAVH